jgi:hypothetical protein
MALSMPPLKPRIAFNRLFHPLSQVHRKKSFSSRRIPLLREPESSGKEGGLSGTVFVGQPCSSTFAPSPNKNGLHLQYSAPFRPETPFLKGCFRSTISVT